MSRAQLLVWKAITVVASGTAVLFTVASSGITSARSLLALALLVVLVCAVASVQPQSRHTAAIGRHVSPTKS